MLEYSVAIRTLGKSPETLRQELISLHEQTVRPKDIVIYIAKGYERPEFTIGMERYIYVNKGMVAQRALRYREISTEYILLLDDDVVFEKEAIGDVLSLMELHAADCIAFDTFKNHEMSLRSKIQAAVTGFVFPRFDKKWAFKIHANDAFSYINSPGKSCYPSMSAAGPAAMWKKESLLNIHLEHELWMDKLGFAYGDDGLQFYKLHANGGKLMVLFNGGVKHLDAKTSSADHHKNPDKFKTIAKATVVNWHRKHISASFHRHQIWNKYLLFWTLITWKYLLILFYALVRRNISFIQTFTKGTKEGINFIHSDEYKALPPYIIINS